ncbi:MAG: ABC transporter permease [Planctomycetes bacterium]|nr:ABC transporter permease [Planctomycetota bacterium]
MKRLPFDYAVRNLGRGPVRLLLSVAGSALVVLLVLASAAFVTGMKRALNITGSDRNVIILGAGSEESIERSEVDSRAATILAASLPGIRTRLNVPYVSPEIHMGLAVKADPAEDQGRLTVVRGVDSRAFLVHPQVRIFEGRAPEAGRDEIMIGRLVAPKLGVADSALVVGGKLWIDGRPWTISGLFEAPQTVMDAEIWCPFTDVQIVAQRDSLSCVVVTLEDAELADVQAFAAQRLDLQIAALGEAEYYRRLAAFFGPIRVMVLVTAALIAMGGVLGGLNTMFAAFSSRVRELGTLQVLGYRRLAIVLSLVQESLVTAAVGAIIAIVLGLLFLDGLAIRFSMGAFGLIVDHTVVLAALAAGLVLGIVGALPPALRCLRMPINQALRSG